MNNLLILKLSENNIKITNLQKVGVSYHFVSETFTDSEVSTQRLTQQLLNLALRKSGAQMPQGGDLNKLMQSVNTCRRELAQYDSEIALPDGRIVEIEQYEYENAVTAITNKIADDVRFVVSNLSTIGKIIILADEADVPLLRSLFLRTFASTIGAGKQEREWLVLNDNATADKALAEAQAAKNAQNRTNTAKPQNQTANQTGRPQQKVEGAYTGQNATQQTRTTQQSRTTRQRRPVNTSGSKAGSSVMSQISNGRDIILIGVLIALVLAIVIIIAMFLASKKSTSSTEAYNNTEYVAVDTDTESSSSSTDSSESTEPAKGNYDYVYPESDGLRKVERDGKKGFIDADGNEVVAPIYDYIYPKSDGLYKVELNGKKGFIDKQGKVVIPVKYDYIYGKADGMYKVEIGTKKGYIRADGTVFIDVKYDYIYSKSDGMYKVELDGKKGFVDATTGKELCPPIYDYIYSFSGGLAKVEKDGKTGYINKQGKLVQPME